MQVPYGKSFHVELEWTASKASKSSTKLVVVGSIVFAKKLLLGGFIQSAAKEVGRASPSKLSSDSPGSVVSGLRA